MNIKRTVGGAVFTLGMATAMAVSMAPGANAATTTVTASCQVNLPPSDPTPNTATVQCPAIAHLVKFSVRLTCHDDVHDSDGDQNGPWVPLPGTRFESCSPTSFWIKKVQVFGMFG